MIDTLREMERVQSDIETIWDGRGEPDSLTQREILLLNYYEILCRALAESSDPGFFANARCIHDDSVRLRTKPSSGAEQIGGVNKDESVIVLGRISYGEPHLWYYVITRRKQIGWAYRYFEFI